MSYKSASSDEPILLDPVHDGTTVRKAILIEGFLNLLSFPLITHTKLCLPLLLVNPAAHMNPASILFARLFGGMVVGALTPALFMAYRNTRAGVDSRKFIYIALGCGEVVMIPILINEALKQGDSTQAALSVRGAVGAIMCLAPPLLWRIYTLFINPVMMGRYKEGKRD